MPLFQWDRDSASFGVGKREAELYHCRFDMNSVWLLLEVLDEKCWGLW